MDRARVYLAVCERQKQAGATVLTEPEDFYYAAVLVRRTGVKWIEAIEHLKHAAPQERRRQGGFPPRVLLRAERRSGRRRSST